VSRSISGNPICDAQMLFTARGNDVIVVVAQCGCAGISSIIDSNGLNFTQRFAYHSGDFLGPAALSCAYLVNPDLVGYIDPCSVSIQTSTMDFVIASTSIQDAGPCGHAYPRGIVPGFTSLVPNQKNDFEVDYAITTVAPSNVVYSCTATDATGVLVDVISFHGAFGLGAT